MRKEPDPLETAALVCTILAAVLTVADWFLRIL
jgi:hypothetical protein